MRVLVTGGAGFVGSHIVDRLLARGNEVLVVDDLSSGRTANLPRDVQLAEIDIGDAAIVDVATSFGPDLVTHCAAQASVAVSMADPAADARTNIVGGINVLNAAVESRSAQLIYVTTGGALYGDPDYLPCDEDHPVRPVSAYGLSKWTLERYLQMLAPGVMQLKVLRLANVYGPRQDPHGEAGVVSIFALRMLKGQKVDIFGDGEQTRDFVYVGDVAEAHEAARLTSQPLVVNISSGKALSVNELFHMMAAETGYTGDPEYRPERPGDIKHVVLANARAEQFMGWRPRTSFQEGLSETLAWMRGQA